MVFCWPRRYSASCVVAPSPKAVPTVERRDWSPLGVARRERFEYSLELLRTLGLSASAVEYYRRLARRTHKLPDELVCALAEDAANDAVRIAMVAQGGGPA